MTDINISKRTTYKSSWSELANIISCGCSYMVISVGDTITFELKNGRQITVRAVAKDAYQDNSIVFCTTDCYEEYSMNPTITSKGGWKKSNLRKHIKKDILPLLPDDLVDVIKERKITQTIGDKTYCSKDKLWIPSRTEVGGYSDSIKDIDCGDVHFEYFKSYKERSLSFNDNPNSWWERSPQPSPVSSNSGGFMYVDKVGNPFSSHPAPTHIGVVVGFMI